jgi:hypothetical protein
MSIINQPQFSRDKEGNLYQLFERDYLYGDTLGNLDTGKATAGAVNCTLAADSSARWGIQIARAVVASIAANTTVTVTLDTGADTYVFPISTNGIHDLVPTVNGKTAPYLADANTAVTLVSDTAGTGGVVSLLLGGIKVTSADV